MTQVISMTPQTARRLAITRQRLAGAQYLPTEDGVYDLVRDLGCLQLDPISVIARSHLIVLWSRLGTYDPNLLETLLWRERRLFEYWVHCASIIVTEDYPIHHAMMRTYARGDPLWEQKVRASITESRTLREHILAELAAPPAALTVSRIGDGCRLAFDRLDFGAKCQPDA